MARETVETTDLVVFLTVSRCGSFTAAAAELLLATPSVSARMAALEQKLSAELFDRTTRGSTLTPTGERFIPYARQCLETLQDARRAMRSEGRSRVVIAAPASIGEVVFGTVTTILSAESLSTHCRVAHSAEVIDHLVAGTADIGLSLSQVARPRMVVRRLCRSELLTVCRPDHPLAQRSAVGVEDLLMNPVAIYRWNPEATVLAQTFERPYRTPNQPVHLVGLPSAAIELVCEQDYVAVVPAFAAAAPLQRGRVTTLALALPGWSLDVQLAYLREAADAPGVQTLLRAEETIRALIVPGSA